MVMLLEGEHLQFFCLQKTVTLLVLIKKGGLLQLKFGGVGVNIYLWSKIFYHPPPCISFSDDISEAVSQITFILHTHIPLGL